jgi:hypothetical protein
MPFPFVVFTGFHWNRPEPRAVWSDPNKIARFPAKFQWCLSPFFRRPVGGGFSPAFWIYAAAGMRHALAKNDHPRI